MNIYGGGTTSGTLLRTWIGTDNASQWLAVSESSGVFSLRAKEATSKCTDVYNGSQSSGTNVILWTFNNTPNQLREFELVSSGDDHGNHPYDSSVFDSTVSFTSRTISGTSKDATVPLTDMMSGTLESGGDIDYFSYTAPYDSYYVFYTTSSIDTFGTSTDENEIQKSNTYDGDLNVLSAQNDDGGVGLNFRITYKLNRGETVYLKVRGYDNSVTGNYILEIRNYYADMYWAWPYTDTNMNVNISNPYYYKSQDPLAWHWGTDIVGIVTDGIANTPLYAAQSGIIHEWGDCGTAGYIVGVKTSNIDISKQSANGSRNLIYTYEHMVVSSLPSQYRTYGASVTKSNNIGLTGKTGDDDYHYHLHYQIHVYDLTVATYRDPYSSSNDAQVPTLLNRTVNLRKFYDYRISFYSSTRSDLDVQNYVW